MKQPHYFLPLLSALGVAVCTTAPALALVTTHSVPPESFLDYHVDTVPQLTFEVTYDKAVRARLAHHFHLTGPAMSAYVRNNLVLQHLRAPLRTRVYSVSARGHEHFVLMTLKRGTPVFALRRTGQPILRLVCGNPLVSSLPPAPKKVLAARRPPALPLVRTLVEPAQMALITPSEGAPALWSVPSITASSSGAALITRGASGAGWLPLLPFTGLAALIPTHHGGGGGQNTPSPGTPVPVAPVTVPVTPVTPAEPPTTPPPPVTSPVEPEPVPEPGPVCVYALGALGVTVLILRRRSKPR